MSWTSPAASLAQTAVKKATHSSSAYSVHATSASTAVGANDETTAGGPTRTTDQATGDLVLPLVIWNDPPSVEISCLQVLYLPMSQPSQNSNALMNRWPSLASVVQQWSGGSQSNLSGSINSLNSAHSMINLQRVMSRRTSKRSNLTADERATLAKLAASTGRGIMDDGEFEYVDDGDLDADDELYQLCVFAGTVDGLIVYWLLEQDIVVQVSMLVHPTTVPTSMDYQDELASGGGTRNRVTSPIQSIVSGIDEWGQSNMISVTRDGAIARWELPNDACSRADVHLASQLAPVKGMEMFCNNRYAIVFGEQSRMMVVDTWKMHLLYCMDTSQEQVRRGLATVELKMGAVSSRKTTAASTESQIRRASDVGESSSSSFSGFMNSSSFSSGSAATSSSSNGAGLSSTNLGTVRTLGAQIWDSLVMSLGSEGLVKCFLWSKPRGGGSSSHSAFGSVASSGSYQWVQESCWVISWADDADDITCSQSTSLKDGDNMNPQTALMRSIKSSYFPRALHISSDASLVLFIWDAKWIVLKRKWLCDVTPPGAAATTTPRSALNRNNAGRSASWKYGSNATKSSKSSKNVGSCRIPPIELLGRAKNDPDASTIHWEDGAFLDNNRIVLWTNSGHVIQFPVSGDSLSLGGKLFIFTKDQDQLVPRSYHKSFNAVQTGELVANLHQCDCCNDDQTAASSFRTQKLRERVDHAEKVARAQGFTSCVITSGGEANQSVLSSGGANVRFVHMCRKGSVGSWTLSECKDGVQSASSSPTRRGSGDVASSLTKTERVKFHALSDGFVPEASPSPLPDDKAVTVAHLLLGREGARSSSLVSIDGRICQQSRHRRLSTRTRNDMSVASTSSPGIMGSSALASALAPVSALLPTRILRSRRVSMGDASIVADHVLSDYLLDVPVVIRGYFDGSLEFSLLGSSKAARSFSNNQLDSKVRVPCHDQQVNAIAHCLWPTASATHTASMGPPGLPRSSTTGSHPDSASKSLAGKRGEIGLDTCLASEKNPFYRSRFPAPVQRRSMSSRHLSVRNSATFGSPPPAPAKFSSAPSPTESSAPSLEFLIFSGCADGVLHVSELTLKPADKSSFSLEVTVLQRFKKHVGSIREVLISPWTREDALCPERYVATIGEDNTINVYAPVYLQNPLSHTAGSSFAGGKGGRCGVEWECVMELNRHPDKICGLEWLIDRGQIQVECEDGMVYVWSIDTGVLERSIPCGLLYGGGNLMQDQNHAGDGESIGASVECSKLAMGDSSVHLIKFDVNKSAEVIKANWKTYYQCLLSSGKLTEVPSPTSSRSPSSLSTASPYAVGSIELLLLAFLLSWGAAPDIDRACRELLGLDSPQTLYSCVLMDDASGALSIPLPWKSIFSPLPNAGECRNPYTRKWQHSPALSATVALGILSLCMNLMEHKYSKSDGDSDSDMPIPSSPRNKEEFHVLWSQLITQHSVVLPDYVPFFREPSLDFLAKYGFHPNDYTQLAARALLSSAIKRLHPPLRSALCAEYSAKLHCEIVRLENETGRKLNGTSSPATIDSALIVSRLGSLVILLSMIGTCYPGEISPAGAREVCDILVCLLRAPVQHVASVAAELLTKGLMLFRPHLVDLSSLITQLLFIDLREKQRNPGGDSPIFGSNARVLASGGSNAALSLLVELGACETAFVLNLLQHEMNNAERPHALRECILLYLTELINTHYLLMFRHLPSVVDTIMCCLDPTKPERRKRCLELSTRCLHNLVRRFPMVDFHKETQRLAIGTMEAVIVIYDLRTATKWRVLDGHTSAISAVGFRSDGQIIVSYAAREGSVRWWNSGNAGLFGGMLKMQQSCIKEHKLGVLKRIGSAPSSSGGASGDLKQVIQTCRFQFLVLKEPQSGNSQQAGTSDRKVLRLTREDASQVQFLM